MIFVTVGTTMKFDDLIREVDSLAGRRVITEPVICQIGDGEYIPQHCEYFRFRPSLDDCISKARLVIGHAGTGTVFSLITQQKRCVFMVNDAGADNHQFQFLTRLEKEVPILWSNNTAELANLIESAKGSIVPEYNPPVSLAIDLLEYLEAN